MSPFLGAKPVQVGSILAEPRFPRPHSCQGCRPDAPRTPGHHEAYDEAWVQHRRDWAQAYRDLADEFPAWAAETLGLPIGLGVS